MKKFLAVVLLVAMCSSFMAVSASASGNGFNIGDFNPDGYGETPDTVVTPSEPSNPDVIIGQDSNENIFDEPDNGVTDKNQGSMADVTDGKKEDADDLAIKLIESREDILDAIKAGENKIKLTDNIVINNQGLPIDKTVTLDLNGHSITFNAGADTAEKAAIYITAENVVIKNGAINVVKPPENKAAEKQVTHKYLAGINAESGSVKLVKVETDFSGVASQDNYFVGNVKTENVVAVIGNTNYDSFEAALRAANGDPEHDTIVLVDDANVTGDVNVENDLDINLNGFTLTADNVNIAAEKQLTVFGGTLKANVAVNGTFNVTSANTTVSGTISGAGIKNITAGNFSEDPSAHLSSDYIATQKDSVWVVSEKVNVAETNGTGYKTVKAAVDAAADGQTVAVKANVSENLTISGKNIVLDLGGNTLNGNITVEAGAGLTVQNGKVGDITVNGTLTVTDKNVTAGTVTLGDKATVNVTAGTFANEFAINSEYTFEKNENGTFTVVEKVSLNPNSAKHIKGTNAGLEVKASAAIESVKRSDKPDVIDAQFYDLSADKTTLTFHADWLNQLTVGEYQIVFTFANNETKTFTLTVDTDTQVKLDPASFTYVKGEAKDTVFTVNQPVTGKVMFGDEEVSDKSFTLDENKTTLTLKADFLNKKNPGSYELKVGTDYGEAVAGVTVKTAVVIDPASQKFELQSDKNVTFTVTSTEDITAVSENDNDLAKDTDYTVKGKKLVFKAEYLNKLAAGSHEFVVRTANGSAKLTIEVAYSETSVTDASGNEITELKFFKGNSAMNNDFKFKTTPELTDLSIGNKVLTKGTDYDVLPNGTISISKDAKFLSELSAGQHALKFALSNGNSVDIKLLVYPTVKFSATHYTKGSNTDIEITVSDMADDILFGSELKPIEDNYWSYDTNSGKYTVSSKFFEAQPEGDLPMGLRYGEMSFTLNGFKVNGNATIKPYNYVDKDGKSVWPYGSDTLGFKVSPDVKGVTIDGTELTDKQYSVDKNGILWIAASKLQKLNYGKHSIVVNTSYGDVEGEFYTKVGVEPKNEDYHVKGGKKNLSFVSSEPVKEVYVGREVLKSSYYSLSKDRMTITLNADFMNRLKADVTYSLTVTTEAGNASCNFRILSPGSAANRPQTGDESNMLIWAAVMVLSGAAVVALVPRKKKN